MELTPFLFGVYKLVKFAVYPFTWLFVLLGFLTILAVAPASPRRLRWIRILAVSTFLLFFLLGNPLVASTLMGFLESQYPPFDHSTTKKFDAIVVLAGGALSQGSLRPSTELTDSSTARTLCGANLYAQGFASQVLFSGGDATIFGQGPIEAMEMKRLAVRLGVPEQAIVLEDRSRNTYEEAIETERILGEASILLVTSASHIPRALGLFHKQGMDVTPYPCGYTAKDRPGDLWDNDPFDLVPGAEALSKSTKAINEITGIIVYWLGGKI